MFSYPKYIGDTIMRQFTQVRAVLELCLFPYKHFGKCKLYVAALVLLKYFRLSHIVVSM